MSAMVSMRRSIPPSSIRDLDIERRVARRVRRQRRVVSPQVGPTRPPRGMSGPRRTRGSGWYVGRRGRSPDLQDFDAGFAGAGFADDGGLGETFVLKDLQHLAQRLRGAGDQQAA